jgi:hypothetical protein
MTENQDYPLNADYGSGMFRRRIRLVSTTATVDAYLEDDFHAFQLHLHHDGQVIQEVEAESIRIPAVACTEAPTILHGFVGRKLTADHGLFRSYDDPRLHCTHLHDLLWLACAHATRAIGMRQYDVTVPDLHRGRSEATVSIDGVAVHCWIVDMKSILAPSEHSGIPLQKGFSSWAAATFSGEALNAAFVLQMGIFVARARRLDVETARRAGNGGGPEIGAVCYTFQPQTRLRFVPTLGAVRDFSKVPERLLKFL